jgi:hypothetical protein
MARLERALTRSGEPVKRKMTMTLEPTDKLDAATTLVAAVNGPEGATLDWHAVDWRAWSRTYGVCVSGSSRACLSRMLGNGHVRF